MSSRRAGAGSLRSSSSRKQALEDIKRMRDGGASEEAANSGRLAQYKPQEESIYKAVTEQEYEDLVRQRRQGLPFVENDDGEMGYYDDGEEQFFESDPEDTGTAQDDDDSAAGKKRSAGALSSSYVRRAKKMQRAKLGGGEGQKITNMFFSASSSKGKSNGAAPGGVKRASAKRDIDLDSMLDDLTSNPTESRAAYARPMSYSTGSSTFSSGSSGFTTRKPFSTSTSSFVSKDNTVEEEDAVDYGDNAYEPVEDEPMQEASADEEREATAEGDEVVTTQEDQPAKPIMSKREMMLRKAREQRLQTSAPTARALAAPVEQKQPEDVTMSSVPSNEVAEWWQVAGDDSNVTMADASADDAEPESLPSAADSIQMYWMDAVEVRERPGKIYLIGKMKIPSPEGSSQPPTFRSCCVVVNNLQRYMYLVPKGTPLIELSKTEQQEAWMKMHEEIHNILIPSCITNKRDQEVFKTKLVDRNYAFEEANIPRGKNQFLKVKYPARYPAPPSDFCSRGGKTFSRICGAFTRPLENFLLTRRLLGPGWVDIKGVRKCTEGVSFCKMEFETFDPKNVTPIAGGMSPPPLTVMSLSLKSVCNPNTGKHEVVALSAITETGISAEGAGKGTKGVRHTLSHFTAIRPLDENNSFPQTYAEAVQRDDRFGMKMENGALSINSERLRVEINERVMLSYFLTRVQREDPDVIVGHNLHKYALELLISRIDNFKLGGLWSKLTRLRRGRLNPMNVGEGWNEYRMDDMVNGRLFCDTYVSSKELLPSQNNYTLSYLVERLLHKQRLDVEMTEIPQILLGGPDNFVKFLRHTLDDAMFVLHLMHKLEILPLSKQLANLCGYLWTRTLEANKRAERIEYLLLHEFSRSRNKFIVPEKFKTRTEADKSNKRREASYAGGMVFAPKKGLYDNFVVLLDFMSLYPSIIREYNICFTTVERQLNEDVPGAPSSSKKKKKLKPMPQPENDEVVDDEDMDQNLDNADANADSEIPALPSSASEPGILPAVIKRLLESRKQVKQQLKIEQKEGNIEKANMLDIRQKAIKLTANSMYGCLGFRFSRFYAKPIAALITSTGRQTLQRAKEVAEQECGYDVIYGDTDSIMVDSRTETLDEAKRIGREIQAQCNKHFKLLELEVDYIFKRILLLNKKKYAALVLKERPNSEPSFDKEVKGLDMVRRDWCVISKAVGNEVLDFILSGNSRDDVVESIHDHLEQVAERMRSGKEPIEQYVITKSLNKLPEQYPDRAKQYHVQVALALRALGKPVGAGTHIPYVLCKEEEPGSGRRAYHPDEVKRANGKLNIDVEWYLESQIHPPVNRLCAHIEGTSSPQLAHCLGLDTAKFSHSANHFEENDGGDAIPSVLQNDADRFKDCVPLEITCDRCKMASAFPGVFGTSEKDSSLASGLLCPVCKADFWGFDKEGIYGNVGDDLQAVLSNRLHIATRLATKKYYEAWTVCSDVTCKTRTQKQSLRGNGNICSAAGCRATTSLEYPDSALYTQLKYFESLFDVERAQKKIREQKERASSATTATEPPPLSERHRTVLQKLLSQAEEAVHRDDYNWVKPSIWQTLFIHQLVQLALMFSRNNRQILWEKLTQLVKGTKKSKEALRQRLKTLKRTHGRKLEHFPAWFFKKEFLTELSPRRLQTSRRTSTKPKSSIRERNKQVKKSRYKRRGRVTSDPEATRSPTTKPERASMPKMSPRCPKCTPAMKTEPLASLQLLASVASTTGHGEGMMNRRVVCCALETQAIFTRQGLPKRLFFY
ncbi:DNA polymerase alpha catalytic subunit [Phytophthora cactorum]|uniref:DNA polymerase n=1 Tax=Phytophthora cactorum TaxID=29920 RepID=A0A8T0Z9H0_9STRA|nr:DNA polymerase alpha catalytic subunit [Phytophthora cactorum]KAG3010843.1 DNA polymerase alpha catalytic subunit [Phytophthora cactorum]KAG3026286.1 DNA polymerase alpha catalytic subunit [Phytophthora cactorum]KAG3081348.1 DNA polymerase alpha catalytic subunit [Phytophthora cactorum]KAG4239905.1 DNA polymerase alpha catalytic subunit [Phytophthora cactorum]